VAVGPLGGFWPKPGGSVDRVEGIIIETLVILCQFNSQIHRVPAGRIVTNKQTNNAVVSSFLRYLKKTCKEGVAEKTRTCGPVGRILAIFLLLYTKNTDLSSPTGKLMST
jgi:hypothetical protein